MKFVKPLSPLFLGIVFAGLIILILAGYFNSFTTRTNAIEGQWKQVEVQYQRRVDLIPNLVESVKGLQRQEQQIFSDVSEARTRYLNSSTPEEKVRAANQLEGSLGRFLVVFENYPQIKSDQAILKLQDELAGTENRVTVERRRYNDLVQSYNTVVSLFPGRFFAQLFGFTPRTYFNAAPGSENVPQVKF